MHVLSRRRCRLLAELVLVAVAGLVATVTFGRATAKQDGDEALWIGSSTYFLTLFVRHDLSAEAWADTYWTRTQPMVPRYLLGAWLWSHGYDVESVDPRYDYSHKWFTNEREGKTPKPEMLDAARVPMRALAVISALLVYGIVRVAAGPLGGLTASLLFSGSPYLTLHLVRAMGESPFLMLFLVALLAGLVAIQRGGAAGPSPVLGIVAGLMLGLSLSSKLTAVLGMVAVVAWAAWMSLEVIGIRSAAGRFVTRYTSGLDRRGGIPNPGAPANDANPAGPRRTASWLRLLVWVSAVIVLTLMVFVASNPSMYTDPLGRAWLMFQNRREEMSAQAAFDPSRAVTSLPEQVRLVWEYGLGNQSWGRSRLSVPLEAVLALVGGVWLAIRAVRSRSAAAAWLLCWAVCTFVGVTVGLGYLLDHYLVPTAAMGTLLAGVAVGWGTSLIWQATLHLHGMRARLHRPLGVESEESAFA